MKKRTLVSLGILFLIVFSYAIWYSHNRAVKITRVQTCGDARNHQEAVMMRAPDGSMVPVYSIETCSAVVIPPPLTDLIRGKITFQNIPKRMVVNPYSLSDVLLGNYTFGSDNSVPCDQSATTTDCSTLHSL